MGDLMKKVSIFLGLLFFAFSTSTFAQIDKLNNESKKLYNAGIKNYKSGNFNGALDNFNKAVKNENNYVLHFWKGQTYRKLKKYDKAIESYRKAYELNKNYYQAYYYEAATLFAMKKYEEAKKGFELTKSKTDNIKVIKGCNQNIIKCEEKLAYPILAEAEKKKNAKDFSKAVEKYNEYLNIIKSDYAYIGLAECYVELGEYEKAIEAADNAINVRKKRSKVPKGAAYFYKGLAFKGLKNADKAKEFLKMASKDKIFRDRSNYELKYFN